MAIDAIHDPDVRILAAIAASLEPEYAQDGEEWIGSPFAWIKTRPSRQVGKIGEQLVSGWLAARGFNVSRSGDSDCDRIIEGKRIEVKFSTIWKSGSYKFQQFRDQRYEAAICLGLSPFDASCWVIPKEELMHQWRDADGIHSQHGGAGGSDTAWLTLEPNNPPGWLSPFGGRLRDAIAFLSKLTGFTPEPVTQ